MKYCFDFVKLFPFKTAYFKYKEELTVKYGKEVILCIFIFLMINSMKWGYLNMIDFNKIAEMSFLVFELDQRLIFDNGIIVDKDNFTQFIQNTYDA